MRNAVLPHIQRRRGCGGEVDDPASGHRTPVVDPHHHGAASIQIGDAHMVPNGSVRCAAVSAPAAWVSPAAVGLALTSGRYQDASPSWTQGCVWTVATEWPCGPAQAPRASSTRQAVQLVRMALLEPANAGRNMARARRFCSVMRVGCGEMEIAMERPADRLLTFNEPVLAATSCRRTGTSWSSEPMMRRTGTDRRRRITQTEPAAPSITSAD